MLTTQIWIVIKQSTNLELKTWSLVWKNVKYSHTLTTTTTGSKCSQKEANNPTDYQCHNAQGPQRSPLYRLMVSVEVKCKTHTQQSTSLQAHGLS